MIDALSPNVISNKGVPIISKFNNEDNGIYKNQRFKIVQIGKLTTTIGDVFKCTKND